MLVVSLKLGGLKILKNFVSYILDSKSCDTSKTVMFQDTTVSIL